MTSITLYTAKICPFAHRVEIALTEANAKFKTYWIDLHNKPEWYASKLNPASKVPTLAYGGPDVPADDPSPESVKLTESLILIEFVADLFPEANLLSKDPILRVKTRLFVDVVSTKFVPAYFKFLVRGEGYADLLAAVEAIQNLLPDTGSYALGDQYTLADISIVTFIARLKYVAENDLGKYPVGQGSEFLQVLGDQKYAKFTGYAHRLLGRQSLRSTFDPEQVKDYYVKHVTRE